MGREIAGGGFGGLGSQSGPLGRDPERGEGKATAGVVVAKADDGGPSMGERAALHGRGIGDRKSTRLNSSHSS